MVLFRQHKALGQGCMKIAVLVKYWKKSTVTFLYKHDLQPCLLWISVLLQCVLTNLSFTVSLIIDNFQYSDLDISALLKCTSMEVELEY